VLLDYGEYNEQGDVSYTIANLEGSILFILGLEVPPDARQRWQKSAYFASGSMQSSLVSSAYAGSGAGGNAWAHNSAGNKALPRSHSRDIKSKYSADHLPVLAAVSAAGRGGGGGANSKQMHNAVVDAIAAAGKVGTSDTSAVGQLEAEAAAQAEAAAAAAAEEEAFNNSCFAQVPMITEPCSFVVKSRDEHTSDDIVAMKQLGT
jgi:hypothetical protein